MHTGTRVQTRHDAKLSIWLQYVSVHQHIYSTLYYLPIYYLSTYLELYPSTTFYLTTFNDTNAIARDSYRVCEAVGRKFMVYKKERDRYVLRCRDCEKPN